jgi:hypothetical protein
LCVVKEENGKDGSIRQKGARVEGDAMRCGPGGGALVSVLPQSIATTINDSNNYRITVIE